MPKSDSFVDANPEWRYCIQVGKILVHFDPQPQQLWMAHLGGAEFKLLSADTVVKMLNEGLDAHCKVLAKHTATGKVLIFEKQPSVTVTTVKPAKSTKANAKETR